MLILQRGVRVFVATAPLDMRGSFDAMAGRVRGLGLEPVDGGLYVFFSKRRKLVAILAAPSDPPARRHERLAR